MSNQRKMTRIRADQAQGKNIRYTSRLSGYTYEGHVDRLDDKYGWPCLILAKDYRHDPRLKKGSELWIPPSSRVEIV